jgi:hypothetical protein
VLLELRVGIKAFGILSEVVEDGTCVGRTDALPCGGHRGELLGSILGAVLIRVVQLQQIARTTLCHAQRLTRRPQERGWSYTLLRLDSSD